jgi:mRNA-degrading endonuclease toxin of MazEF toxin-antitoxin module
MINPRPGEVYWVDLGLKGKVRPVMVVSREDPESERALSVCVPLTTQIRGGRYEVLLPRVRWMPGADEGVANVLGILSIEHHFLQRKAGRFDSPIIKNVRNALSWLLELGDS